MFLIRKFLIALFLTWAVIVTAFAGDQKFEYLIRQANRPSVFQVMYLLKNWNPPALKIETGLPLEKKVQDNLHYNYPAWFKVLIDSAPEMIVDFEKAFPGATFAFIGRDTDIFADLFEAFYSSIQQYGRVVRVPMSRGTLETLDQEMAVSFLRSFGLDPGNPKKSFVLVDSISGGGGRQGRFLIESAFRSVKHDAAMLNKLASRLSFVGLKVYTTDMKNKFYSLSEVPQQQSAVVQMYSENTYSPNGHPVFLYSDQREEGSFLGTNEAGYGHWIGLWHGPYGKAHYSPTGHVEVEITDFSDEVYRRNILSVHSAVLNYQAHIIQHVTSPQFLAKVQKAASNRGFQFP